MFLPWRVSQSFFPFFFFLITWSSSHWLVFLQSVFVCHMKSADKKAINCKGCNFKGWFYYQLSTKCTILSGAILESCKLAERQSLQWRIKRKPQGDKQLGGGQEWDPPTVLRILNRQQNKKGWKKADMRAAPSNFHLPSSYLSHFGWIASRTTSFFFLIEIQLPCGDAKACKHCCPWNVFSIVLNQISAAPHFIALRQGPIGNFLLQLGNQCKDIIWQKVRVIACFSLWKWKLLSQVWFFVPHGL